MPPTMPQCSQDTIRHLESHALGAWPALETVWAHGWALRFAGGYTKRANSVNALEPSAPLAALFHEAGAFYASRRLPLIVRVTPLAGPDADAFLDARRFSHADPCLLLTAPTAAPDAPDPDIRLDAGPDTVWSQGFATASKLHTTSWQFHDRLVTTIPQPRICASLCLDGVPVAFGLAVAGEGLVGLFDIVTAPEARRQGAARRLVTALLAWGYAQGAHTAYLQVLARNTPALALYSRTGFREAYRYHYRIAP